MTTQEILFGSDAAQAATACASLTPTRTIGPYFVDFPLATKVAAGRATLSLTAKDANANTKLLNRILTIPERKT